MTRASRLLALVAALALPVGAAVALLLLADPEPPREPATVRIGESAAVTPPPPTSAPTPSAAPSETWLPPPPPVDGGDLENDLDDLDDNPDDTDDDDG